MRALGWHGNDALREHEPKKNEMRQSRTRMLSVPRAGSEQGAHLPCM